MKNYFLLFVSILLISIPVFSLDSRSILLYDLLLKKYGGPEECGSNAIIHTEDGICTVGNFTSTAQFDNLQIEATGPYDMYIAQWDSLGNILWVQQAGGTGYNTPTAIAKDMDGYIYVTGSFSGTTSFGDHTLTAGGHRDIFVCKLDKQGGDFKWAVKAGGSSFNSGDTIAVGPNGKIFVGGYFRENAYFGEHHVVSAGGWDGFIAMMDQQNFESVNTISGTGLNRVKSISYDFINDNLKVAGFFHGLADFGNDIFLQSVNASKDMFIAKYNCGTEYPWCVKAAGYGGPDNDEICSIVTGPSCGNTYVTGTFWGTAQLGQFQIISNGLADIFVASFNDNLDCNWVAFGGGPGYNEATSIAYNPKPINGRSIVFSGTFGETAQIGDSLLEASEYQDLSYIGQVDPWGMDLIADQTRGTSNGNQCYAVSCGEDGSIAITGFFYDTMSIGDQEIVSDGFYSGFFATFKQKEKEQDKAIISISAGTYSCSLNLQKFEHAKQKDTEWERILIVPANKMLTGDITGDGGLELIAFFDDYGLYFYSMLHKVWTKISGDIHPCLDFTIARTSSEGNSIIISRGNKGIFYRNNEHIWVQISHHAADKLISNNVDRDESGMDELIVTFTGINGLYLYDFEFQTWSRLASVSPDYMVCADVTGDGYMELIITFENYGIYLLSFFDGQLPENKYQEINLANIKSNNIWTTDKGIAWNRITSGTPLEGHVPGYANITGNSGAEVFMTYSGNGWTYYYNYETGNWDLFSLLPFKKMISGRFTGREYDDIIFYEATLNHLILFETYNNNLKLLIRSLPVLAMTALKN